MAHLQTDGTANADGRMSDGQTRQREASHVGAAVFSSRAQTRTDGTKQIRAVQRKYATILTPDWTIRSWGFEQGGRRWQRCSGAHRQVNEPAKRKIIFIGTSGILTVKTESGF